MPQYREEMEIPATLEMHGGTDFKVAWCRYAFAERESLSTRSHKHGMLEIHYVRFGALRFRFSGWPEITVSAEEYIIIPPDTVHEIVNEHEHTVKFVAGFQEIPGQENAFGGLKGMKEPMVLRASRTLELLADALLEKENDTMSRFFTDPYIVSSLIFEAMERMARERRAMPRDVRNNERIGQLLRYIREQAFLNMTAAQIAEHFDLSDRQLNRVSKRMLGKTVADLINEERIRRSRMLLKNSNYSLTDISLITGFSDEYSFIRFFKRFSGMPPGQFRRTHSLEENE
ncbi:MAG: helix-turn-helix transcriptional regulator [Clostridia bacterium]|nr:helix-turn-helix transcriptional regulator [Clostridia bacterium]